MIVPATARWLMEEAPAPPRLTVNLEDPELRLLAAIIRTAVEDVQSGDPALAAPANGWLIRFAPELAERARHSNTVHSRRGRPKRRLIIA